MALTDSPTLPEQRPPATDHREPWFARLARFSGRRRRAVMVVWLALIVVAAPLALTLTSACRVPAGRRRARPRRRCATSCAGTSRKPAPRPRSSSTARTTPIARGPGGPAAARRRAAGRARGGARRRPAVTRRRTPGWSRPTGAPRWSRSSSPPRNDARLPESAGKLIDHVDAVSLPDGRTAKVTGEWAVWSDFNAEQRGGAAPRRARVRAAHHHPAARRLRLRDRRRASRCCSPLAGIAVGFARAAPARRRDAAVGVVDELLDDDRPRRRHRLQPVHRLPLPRGTRGRPRALDAIANTLTTAGKAVFLSAAHRRVVARRGVRRAGHGVPVDGARHDPRGRRRRRSRRSRCCRRCWSRSATGCSSPRAQDPDRAAEGRWARWTGIALRRPGPHPGRRPRAAVAARRARPRHAPGHARRPRRRQGPVEPRRLRHGRRSVRSRRCGAALRHRARSPTPKVVAAGSAPTRTWSTPASPRRPRRTVASPSGSHPRPRSTTPKTSDLVGRLR